MNGTKKPIKISFYICKYLKILRLREGYSSHTIRAYGADLMQVFHIKNRARLVLNENKNYVTYKINWAKNIRAPKKSLLDWKLIIEEQTKSWNNLSIKTKKRKWSSLNSFLSWLSSEENLEIEIFTPQLVKTPEKIPNFLSVDECLVLSHYLIKPTQRIQCLNQQTLLFFLMYGAGLRLSEACHLGRENIDLPSRKILFKGKGNKERIVVLPPFVCSILVKYADLSSTTIWGPYPLNERTAYERIRQLGKKAGLFKKLNPHALRHSYASQLLTSGADLRVLQQLLGHKSLSATELYTHLDIDHLARSMEDYHPLGSKK